MKVLIIGANGKIGRLLSKKLNEAASYQPTAFIRKEEQKSYFESINVPTVSGDLESSVDDLSKIIKDFDAVVFTAGSGGKTGYDKTLEIDLDGAIKSVEAAKKVKANRFVMVSASHADQPEFWAKSGIKPYYIAKHYADKALKESGLDYTIIRPVRLTDDEQVGKVKATTNADEVNAEVPRIAVAETITYILNDQKSFGKIIELSEGQKEIKEALEAVC